jgi:hypothetical protein
MTDREVQAARALVDHQSSDARRCLALALVAALIVGVVMTADARWAIVPLSAASVLTLWAVVRARQRAELLDRLALDPSAYEIPAVDRHGRRAAGRAQLRRLAFRLEIVLGGEGWAAVAEAERVARYERELAQLTRRIAAPDTRMAPPQAVACRRLLTRCAESPLYNERVPAEDLGAALHRIAAGVSGPPPA